MEPIDSATDDVTNQDSEEHPKEPGANEDPLDLLYSEEVQEYVLDQPSSDYAWSGSLSNDTFFPSDSISCQGVVPTMVSSTTELLPIHPASTDEELVPIQPASTSVEGQPPTIQDFVNCCRGKSTTNGVRPTRPPWAPWGGKKTHISNACSDNDEELIPIQPASTSMEGQPPTIQDPKDTTTRRSSRSRNTTKPGARPTRPPFQKKKKRRHDVALTQMVAQVSDDDVLFGKGGKINKHRGNLKYHAAKKTLQLEYLDPKTTKPRKQELVKQLHTIVVQDMGGRFLTKVGGAMGGQQSQTELIWVEAHPRAALEKCRQALATPPISRTEQSSKCLMYLGMNKF